MKKLYLLLALVPFVQLSAQTLNKDFENLVDSERKAASKRMAVVINPDTYNYDVTYHKLEFKVDPANFYIEGKVTTTYTAITNMTSLVFDLARITDTSDPNYSSQIEVSSVKMNGNNLTFTRNDEELIINLPTTQAAGSSATVEITYAGAPAGSGFGSFITTDHNGTPVLWTLSEPFGARDWWPCKQDLNDKVNAIDVYITAPSQYNSVSNGLQQSKTDNGDGTSTTHFHHGYAIPAYLVAIAVTDYQIYNQQGGLGTTASPFFPIVNYMFPETAPENTASVSVTPDIINFYETKFGDYPFRNEKYGHAQFGWGGGMEHTTVSFMTADDSGAYSRELIAHEMGHQWFGDKVTCGSWKDIWLNEGFATYLAAMVIEHFDGDAAFTTEKGDMISIITSNPSGAVYLTDSEALSVNRIFSSRLTYNKGAMVLNMLRFKLGDANFFQALRNYLNDPLLAYGYALTSNLKSHLENVSGISLTEFFNDWVYNQGYPSYNINVQSIAAGQARVTINQTQSHSSVSFFEMPVPIRLTGSGGQQQDYVLDNTTNGQQFIINVPFTPTGVVFNPKKDIISKNSNATLAADVFEFEATATVYPNPATDELNVVVPQNQMLQSVVLYNALGQKIGVYNTEKVNLNGLSAGMYSAEIMTNSGRSLKKFIKK